MSLKAPSASARCGNTDLPGLNLVRWSASPGASEGFRLARHVTVWETRVAQPPGEGVLRGLLKKGRNVAVVGPRLASPASKVQGKGSGKRPLGAIRSIKSTLGGEEGDDLGLDGEAGDNRLVLGQIDVNFASDAEIAGQIDPGLNGKAGVRDKSSLILGLKVVDVGAVAMHLFAD